MAVDPSLYGGFLAGLSDYWGNQMFSDTAETTACTNGVTIASWKPQGTGLTSFQANANNRPTARLGGSGLNGNRVADAILTPIADVLVGGASSQYATVSALSMMWLFKPRSIVANSATTVLNDGFVANTTAQRFGLYLRNDTIPKLQFYVNGGGDKTCEVPVSTGAWQLGAARFGKGIIECTLGGGTWSTPTTGVSNIASLTATLRIFGNNGASTNFDGECAGLLFFGDDLYDAAFDDLAIRFWQDYYGSGNAPWTRLVPSATTYFLGGGFGSGAFNEYGFNDQLPDVGVYGSGGVVFSKPAFAGAGLETITGTGAVSFAVPSLAGAGLETISGSGAVVFAKPTLDGAGSETMQGSGGVTFGAPSLAGAGLETITGAGAITFAVPSFAGVGFAEGIIGAGGITFGVPTLAGAGLESMSGSGGVVFGAPSLAGAGLETITGSGAIQFAAPALAGAGFGNVIIGAGGVTFGVPALAGTGTETITGSGGVTLGRPSFAGAGVVQNPITGSGGVTFARPSFDGAGIIITPIVGAGGVVFGRPSILSTGLVQNPIIGAGGVVFGRPVFTGFGQVANPVGPDVFQGCMTVRDMRAGRTCVGDMLPGYVTVVDRLAAAACINDVKAGAVLVTDALAGVTCVNDRKCGVS